MCVHVCVGAHVHACTRARVRACLDITAHVAQLLRNHVHACLDISAHIVQRDSVPNELPQNNVYLGVVGVVSEELEGLQRPRLCTAYGSTFFHATLMRTRSWRL